MENTIPLADGTVTKDPRLDRLVKFDERSRNFPIRTILGGKPRSYTWRCPVWLDQGREGACTGFSVAHEIAARPSVSAVDASLAQRLYRRAQQIDEWPGEAYEGSSVLAAMKAATEEGYFSQYRWAFGIDDLIMAVGSGPAVLGINWYEGMFDVDSSGWIHVDGEVAGGHAILCHGVSLKGRCFKLHNSWGRSWGVDGECKISFEDTERLLNEQGEACVPISRIRKR